LETQVIRAYLFDLDGVIVDSMPVHVLAWKEYLRRHGLPSDELNARMHGRRNDEIVEAYWGKLPPDENFAHGAAKEALFRELIEPEFARRLVPGAREFIHAANGRPKGLGSNAERANIDFTLDRASLRECFHGIVDGHQVARAKPDPEIYLRLARHFEVAPAECLVFEDSVAGVTAARAAGMRVVGVDTGRVGLQNVDLRIAHFEDPALRPWLEANA
jgi:HAD superfamily hydrolase (TIGR01509 family)